jgi:hypothetical protein
MDQVEPAEQSVRDFAGEELASGSLESARALGVKYGDGGEQTPAELDRIFWRWRQDTDDKPGGEELANALGAAFGEFLIERHGFRWALVTDEFGTEYTVRHSPGETMAFPRSSVEKRLDVDDPEIFQNLTAAIVHRLREAEEESS